MDFHARECERSGPYAHSALGALDHPEPGGKTIK